jgi:hypothetical protein
VNWKKWEKKNKHTKECVFLLKQQLYNMFNSVYNIFREVTPMVNYIVLIAILFIILVSIQYSINKIIVLLKEIKEILLRMQNDQLK